MKRLFIVNPSSASGSNLDEFSAAKQYFERELGEFSYVLTKDLSDISVQTKKALKDGAEQIIAVGGDGTIHWVVNGFFEDGKAINPDALLAISNTGTGSDYFRTIVDGVKNTDWKKVVTDHEVKEVDLGYIHFADGKEDQFFNNMASLGVSADIVTKKEELPDWFPSKLSYLFSTLLSITTYSSKRVEIDFGEGKMKACDLFSLFISKGIYAGGGMKFGEGALLDSGKFLLTLVEKIPPVKILKNLKKLYFQGLDTLPEVTRVESDHLSFHSDEEIGVELDGEFIGSFDQFKISLQAKAIKVCFPKQ